MDKKREKTICKIKEKFKNDVEARRSKIDHKERTHDIQRCNPRHFLRLALICKIEAM